ncbi:hypothetical protein ACJX0J_034003 [Zea mays]
MVLSLNLSKWMQSLIELRQAPPKLSGGFIFYETPYSKEGYKDVTRIDLSIKQIKKHGVHLYHYLVEVACIEGHAALETPLWNSFSSLTQLLTEHVETHINKNIKRSCIIF